MTPEEMQKMLEAIGNGGINVKGDLVLEKHVEYEVANVEPGGIGIQINNTMSPVACDEVDAVGNGNCSGGSQDNTLNETRKAIADELMELVEKGDWVDGVTAEDIKLMLRNVLGIGEVTLTAKQAELSGKLWLLLEDGRKGAGGRVRIIWENIVGFLDEKRLFVPKGSPALNKDFFGDSKGYTNIDKGRPGNDYMSNGFRETLPLLEEFAPKLPKR